jgi:hypothetical protein
LRKRALLVPEEREGFAGGHLASEVFLENLRNIETLFK